MIFVAVGTVGSDFSRLLRWIDALVEEGLLHDVVAQVGPATYQPRNYLAHRFLPCAPMLSLIEKAEFVICHGGAATLDECLALRKKVIVVPRCAEYRESVDDHQFEIAEYLADMNRVLLARDLDELRGRLAQMATWSPLFAERRSTQRDVAAAIRQFVESTMAREMKKRPRVAAPRTSSQP